MQVYGPEASGKTTLAMHACAEIQRLGGTVAYIDVEHAFDRTYAEVGWEGRRRRQRAGAHGGGGGRGGAGGAMVGEGDAGDGEGRRRGESGSPATVWGVGR